MKCRGITFWSFFLTFTGAMILWSASAWAGSPISQTDKYALFGSTEIRSTQLTSFTNWTGMLNRFTQKKTLGPAMCHQPQEPAYRTGRTTGNQPPVSVSRNGPSQSITIGSYQSVEPRYSTLPGQTRTQINSNHSTSSNTYPCPWQSWQQLIEHLRPLPPMQQLTEVNRLVNAHRYILDQVNWGMNDYWATVFEFLQKNGDCEDFAIAKYVTLRALGWPAQSLRIVILRDTQLNLNHAVLAAYTTSGIYIGDNQVKTLVNANNIHHYRPIYSINEQAWWLHRDHSTPTRRY